MGSFQICAKTELGNEKTESDDTPSVLKMNVIKGFIWT